MPIAMATVADPRRNARADGPVPVDPDVHAVDEGPGIRGRRLRLVDADRDGDRRGPKEECEGGSREDRRRLIRPLSHDAADPRVQREETEEDDDRADEVERPDRQEGLGHPEATRAPPV